MQSLLPLILIGFFIYIIFSGKGGMGCCGGHSHGSHGGQHQPDGQSDDIKQDDPTQQVIDLHKDEYTILPAKNDKDYHRT